MGKIKDWWNDHKERIGEVAYAATVGLLITVDGVLLGCIIYNVGKHNGYHEGLAEWANSDWDSFEGAASTSWDKALNDYKQKVTDAEKEES